MANQITIDIGAAANDGTGDPLRTAFNYVNNNFSNVWNTGLPNSNVQFLDNRILTVNTNANLVLAPNGIGKVASNVDIVPNTANAFALGGLTRRWNTIYGQYLDISHNATIGGNLTVTGNLSAGNISYTSNVFVGDLEGSVFDGASSIVLDVIDSAIYVDNYYYANGVPFGGGSNYGNTNVASFLAAFGSNSISTTGNISAGNASVTNVVAAQNITATTGTFTGDQFSDGAMYVGSPAGTILGSDVVIQITANAGGYSQTNFQNINSGPAASSDYILTADNGNDTTHFLDMGITSSGWDGSETNVLSGLTPNNGYLYVQDGNLSLGVRNGNTSYSWKFDTTGNLTVAGNVIPTGNNTQSLGSATRQWNDLYLSNATIYMNSVPISLNSSNVMTVNGQDVVTTNTDGNTVLGNLQVIGSGIYIAYGSPETLINISPDPEGWAYLQLPDDATANSANTRLHNDAGNVEIGTGNFSTGSDSYTWTFDTDGTLTLPGNSVVSNGRIISLFGGEVVKLQSQANGTSGLSALDSTGGAVASMTISGTDGDTDRVIVSTYNADIDENNTWTFNTAGDFTTAGGNIFFTNQANNAVITPDGFGIKIAADRGDVTSDYIQVSDSGINLVTSGSSADINIEAGDDVAIRGGDKVAAPQTRGGDIYLTPGKGGDDGGASAGPGGNAEIVGGDGGDAINGGPGDGGDVSIVGGLGGAANVDNALSAGPGGAVFIVGGTGGNNRGNLTLNGNGGNVDIFGGNGSFDEANLVPVGAAGDVNLYGGNWGWITPSGNVNIGTYNGADFRNWKFDNQGRTYFPVLSTARGDTTSGTITGYTLRIGDGQDEVVITTPDGDVADNPNSERIVINPGKGGDYSSGEGGDIYLWAGRGGSGDAGNAIQGGSGGDIKIRGGQGGGDDGAGGYIRMEAGDGAVNAGQAGYVEIRSGTGQGGATGGNITIISGQGDISGGNISITGGLGTAGPGGNISIVGGVSSNGLPEYGNVFVSAGASTWAFDNTGVLTVPGEGILNSINDTVTLQTFNTSTGNANSVYLGTSGGLGFFDQAISANWLEIFRNGSDPEISARLGNLLLVAATGTSGGGGSNVNITGGSADQMTYSTTAGGNVNIVGGVGAFNDGGGGGQGGGVNISSGLSADPAGVPGNVTVNTGPYTWNFDYNGTLNLPDGTAYIGSAANVLSLHANDTEAIYISQISNGISLETDGNVTILSNVTGNVNYAWTFDNTGVLTAQGNITTTGIVSGQTLVSTQSAANEGGEITLALPSSGSTLSGSIIIDSYQNQVRIFEGGGNSRGLYVDVPNVSTSGQYAIGYRDVPQIALSGNITANSITAGKHFYSTTAGNLQVTIPDNANVAFPTGATITVVVNAAGNVIVAQGTGVSLYMAGSSTTGNRAVGAYGLASIMKVATDTWVISGTGVY